MRPVDFAPWTTTLTASYLAITAALIAIPGNAVPGRTWLVALHLTLSALLLLVNRARPSAGIRRVILDWHPLLLFPLLYRLRPLPLRARHVRGRGPRDRRRGGVTKCFRRAARSSVMR